jgi:uncharacterized repeat protein (TIGR03803 family)
MRIGVWLNLRRWISAVLLFAAATAAPWQGADAYTYQVIYNFCSLENCEDGFAPSAGLILDTQGNLYGTASQGGYNENEWGSGTAFELLPPTTISEPWGYVKLRKFCETSGCSQGAFPTQADPLAYAGAGTGAYYDGVSTLYGTTGIDGPYPCQNCGTGTIYGLTPNATRTSWTGTTLRMFASTTGGLNSVDNSGLVLDRLGILFGVRLHADLIYELTPPAKPHGRSRFTELYHFCSKSACADGDGPEGTPIIDKAGNLYGVTVGGGNKAISAGTVYELSPPRVSGGRWTETVLHVFCLKENGCPDGAGPSSSLLMDDAGNLYGTTAEASGGVGNVFMLSPPTASGTWTETVLYTFCSRIDPITKFCADGRSPLAALIRDGAGNLYGTTPQGGLNNGGTVFELSPPTVSGGKWTHRVLYDFCEPSDEDHCPSDGYFPFAPLVMDEDGNLYGTAYVGGQSAPGRTDGYSSAGVVFELVK